MTVPWCTDGDQWDHMCELAFFFHLRDQTWLGGKSLYPLTVSLAVVVGIVMPWYETSIRDWSLGCSEASYSAGDSCLQ